MSKRYIGIGASAVMFGVAGMMAHFPTGVPALLFLAVYVLILGMESKP